MRKKRSKYKIPGTKERIIKSEKNVKGGRTIVRAIRKRSFKKGKLEIMILLYIEDWIRVVHSCFYLSRYIMFTIAMRFIVFSTWPKSSQYGVICSSLKNWVIFVRDLKARKTSASEKNWSTQKAGILSEIKVLSFLALIYQNSHFFCLCLPIAWLSALASFSKLVFRLGLGQSGMKTS